MIKLLLFVLVSLLIGGCTAQPQPIDFGNDQCHYCKMTIADQRYGAELITKKGKVYKYDAVECLISSVFKDKFVDTSKVHSFLVIDFSEPGKLIDVHQCQFLQSYDLPSPMGMFITPISDQNKISELAARHKVELFKWNEIILRVINRQLPSH